MQRDLSAYLNDILGAAAAIKQATAAIDEDSYGQNRLIRSAAVEREFIIIGEAYSRVPERERPCGLGCYLDRSARPCTALRRFA